MAAPKKNTKQPASKTRRLDANKTLRRRPYFQEHKGWFNMGFYDPSTRKTKWIALRTDDQKEAEGRYWQIYELWEQGRFDPHRDTFRGTATLAEAVAAYLAHLEELASQGKRKHSTLRERRTTLEALCRTLPADLFVGLVQPEDCDAFVSFGSRAVEPSPLPLAPQTALGYYQRLAAFFTWCTESGYLETSPVSEVDRPRVGKIVPKFLTPAQVERLLTAIRYDHAEKVRALGMDPTFVIWVHDWVLFLVTTALRPAEAQGLLWENVDLDGGYLYVRNTAVHDTKTGDEGTVPLAPQAVEVLTKLHAEQVATGMLAPDAHVFRGPGGGPVSLTQAEEVIRAARRIAKLPAYTQRRRMRASCASYLKRMGLSDGFISAVLRHTDPRTIRHYAALATEDVKAEVTRAFAKWGVQPATITASSAARALEARAVELDAIVASSREILAALGVEDLPAAFAAVSDGERAGAGLHEAAALLLSLAAEGPDASTPRIRPINIQQRVSEPVPLSPFESRSGTGQKKRNRPNRGDSGGFSGAEHGTRTRDLNLGKVALYQLS
jgi:integrase